VKGPDNVSPHVARPKRLTRLFSWQRLLEPLPGPPMSSLGVPKRTGAAAALPSKSFHTPLEECLHCCR
jgi:hypothetical protein